jgi:hypothetical protein
MTDDELTEEQLQKEILRSQAVTKVAEVIVRNGELALKTMEHMNEYGYDRGARDAALHLGRQHRGEQRLSELLSQRSALHAEQHRLHRDRRGGRSAASEAEELRKL